MEIRIEGSSWGVCGVPLLRRLPPPRGGPPPPPYSPTSIVIDPYQVDGEVCEGKPMGLVYFEARVEAGSFCGAMRDECSLDSIVEFRRALLANEAETATASLDGYEAISLACRIWLGGVLEGATSSCDVLVQFEMSYPWDGWAENLERTFQVDRMTLSGPASLKVAFVTDRLAVARMAEQLDAFLSVVSTRLGECGDRPLA